MRVYFYVRVSFLGSSVCNDDGDDVDDDDNDDVEDDDGDK